MKQDGANWQGVAKHLLTGLAVISFVWVVRRVQGKKAVADGW